MNATDLSINDYLPSSVQLINAQLPSDVVPSGQSGSNILSYYMSNFPANETRTLILNVQFVGTGVIRNTADIHSNDSADAAIERNPYNGYSSLDPNTLLTNVNPLNNERSYPSNDTP